MYWHELYKDISIINDIIKKKCTKSKYNEKEKFFLFDYNLLNKNICEFKFKDPQIFSLLQLIFENLDIYQYKIKHRIN